MERNKEFGITENQVEEDNDSMDMQRTDKTETLILPDAFLKSKKKPLMVDYVQCDSPSLKFQAKLIEKDKEKEHHTMELRIKKLQIDQSRAEKQLKKTLDLHFKMKQIHERKQSDLDFKKQWLAEQNENLEQLREKNTKSRLNLKNGMANSRQNWIITNHIAREQKQLDFLQRFQSFQ